MRPNFPSLLVLALATAVHPGSAVLAGSPEIYADSYETRLPPGLVQGDILEWSAVYGAAFPLPNNSVEALQVNRGSVLSIRFTTPVAFQYTGTLVYVPGIAETLAVVSISRVAGDFDPATVAAGCLRSPAQQIDFPIAAGAGGPPLACRLESATEYYLNIHVGSGSAPDATGGACGQDSCVLLGGTQLG